MNKAELVAAVAEKTGFTKKDAEVAVNAFVSCVEDALTKGESDLVLLKPEKEKQDREETLESLAKLSRLQLQKLLYSKQARL